ncbi:unnamed protein product [Ophioblennius macclurei]
MQADFRSPRRRTRVQEDYQAPLPGQGQTRTPRDQTLFRAELVNQHVLVWDPDHIHKLYHQGYFGKGILSRSRPDHSLFDQWEERGGVVLPVLTRHRYQQLLGWAESRLRSQGLDEAAVSVALLKLSRPMELEEVEPQLESEALKNCRSDPQVLDQDSQSPSQDADPGLVLVDSDIEAGVRELRRTPVCLSEYLQLSLEETFFLVYSLGCLSVCQQQVPLSVVDLWRSFRSLHPDFVSSYAVYHHCRSRGWVPKGGGGAKYGVDFMLYRKGPPFYHASYSVVIQRADDVFGGGAWRSFSWRSLAALSRITANVSKELLLCYVVYPFDLSEVELDSPKCLSRLKVQGVVVSRWVSSKERTEQDDI